jgi:hypothetical protein
MKITLARTLCLLGLFGAPAAARAQGLEALAGAGGEVGDATVASVARRFAAELKCGPASKDPHRGWCPVGGLDKAGFSAPAQAQVLLGLTVELADGAKVPASLLEHVRLGVLSVGPSSARITDLRPSNKDEEKELAGVIFELGKALKGQDKAAVIPVSKGLAGYLQGEGRKPGRPLRTGAGGAHFTGQIPARLYRLTGQPYGDAYVVVEQAPNGIFVSIYPALAFRAK